MAETVEQMLERGWSLDEISGAVKRRVFARVVREECRLRGECGAMGRAADRLGVHRNTATRYLRRWREGTAHGSGAAALHAAEVSA